MGLNHEEEIFADLENSLENMQFKVKVWTDGSWKKALPCQPSALSSLSLPIPTLHSLL